ncbi:non-ribosomal peptide synthase domain TIGR01720/amino acid adenylation domain-containing protein [Amycolatopsis xylanica]|uniref:Non-ribosomal peptide synthase domain TIGR01720/amino acid adenylation domain-containing protein n=1 Tax=Amycolatopsis xylanica TaxID=589385 RepID=A0A1H2THK7_9PSEU|nr:non-ribosomal peptide synthetase [Amycolatopsis xylanica]SDW43401.1 non-ribosomal peptide synthase domain TIGR01720/amino acid adenylation domain-containing protein [Amycolatopsis xylanica]
MSEETLVEDVLPLSPLQQGMLFHASYDESGADVYTVQTVLGLEGELDAERLREAAVALLRRHPNLRACFVQEDMDEPVQVVLSEVDLPWTYLDLSTVDDQEAKLAAVLAADRVAPFDLENPPLIRFTVVKLGPAEHRLVLTNHHILLDGWSLPLLVTDLLGLYAGRALPPVRPFRDYLAWLAAQDAETALGAWKSALDGITEPTLLAPSQPSRVPVPPGKLKLELPEELTQRLYTRARELGVTANTIVQSGWGLVLARLTGRDDVVFGATVSGRPADLAGVGAMVGLFINTVPVRVRAGASAQLSEVVCRVQRDQVALMDFQHVGLSEIQRSTGDLFDTLVVFESYPIDDEAVAAGEAEAGLRLGRIEVDDATHYPMTLAVAAERELAVTFEFRPDVFDREFTETVAGYFRRAVEHLADGGDSPVAAVDLLGEAERARLLGFGTGKALDVPAVTLAQVFEEQSRLTPGAIAVVGGETRLTFAEVNARANRLARYLAERGAGPERIVALALPPGPDVLVALVAVLKTGGAYLPLDPDWPADRLEVMIADAKPAVTLWTYPDLDGYDDRDPEPRAHPGNPAYVIYTSGSTGTPKAVVVSHRSIVNLLVSHRTDLFDPARAAAGGRPLRVGHAWPMAFDASWQPMLWMFAGHELHLVPPDVRRDADALREFLAAHRIEFIELSPSLLGQVASEPGWRGELKVLGVGGEAVPPDLWRTLRETEGLAVHNLYGPTECTVDAAACEFSRMESPCIGSPVGNARAYVLDRQLNHCPPGVEGELYLAGAGLARGYLGRPGITASRFMADPFGQAGDRMYRTGDVARWTPDGLIDCRGRVDDQVKIRGFRIEPGEIEAVLLSDDRVARAAVVVREDLPGVRRLVAYVVLRNSTVDGLRELVASRLPEYMVPVAVLPIDTFPLTPNGKFDTAALAAPDLADANAVAPRTEREQRFADLFAEVLGLDTVGVEDSFFALGGDSIVSMRLVSKARAAGLKLSPRDVFEHRTVAALAGVAAEGVAPERASDGVGDIPLTPMLRWFAEQGTPHDRFSQARFLITPAGLDEAGLRGLVQSLLDRHDVLRTTFARADGRWRFTARPVGTVRAEDVVRRVDASGLSYESIGERLPGVLEEDLATLAPARGAMARFTWFDAGDGRPGRLLILLHHLVVDGASWGFLVQDLADDWAALQRGEAFASAYPGTSFREWALGLEKAAATRLSEVDLWRDMLSGPDPVLGARRLDPAVDTRATVRAARTSLDADVTRALLTTVPAEHGVSVDAVLLAALARALRGDGSLLVALEGHGREEQVVDGADLSGTVGWFTTVFPVRVDPGDGDVHKRLSRVEEQLALPDKGIGHGLLRYLAEALPELPEPQIEFNYLGRLTAGERSGEPWTGAPETGAMGGGVDDAMPAPYCLVLNALVRDHVSGPVLEADWQWPSALFTEERIKTLSDAWFAALTAIARGEG